MKGEGIPSEVRVGMDQWFEVTCNVDGWVDIKIEVDRGLGDKERGRACV